MNRILLQTALWGAGLVLLAGSPAWAQADLDGSRLQATNAAIDKSTAPGNQTILVQTISKQFNVPVSTVETLRAQKQGFGEVTIQLAMAQHLTQTDPKTYPTLNDALTKIGSLRSEHIGWGKIAQDLGFKLGPVVANAERTRLQISQMGSDLRQDRTGQVARQERMERPDRPQRPERPERPMMPERPMHR